MLLGRPFVVQQKINNYHTPSHASPKTIAKQYFRAFRAFRGSRQINSCPIPSHASPITIAKQYTFVLFVPFVVQEKSTVARSQVMLHQ
jgi:hypothetical protein